MRALKSSGSYSPRASSGDSHQQQQQQQQQLQKRVVLCPQSDTLLQTLKRLSQRKDLWVLDSLANECFLCSQRFSSFRRRHHCRICGQVFCKKCTQGSIELYSSSVRCCNSCLTFLQVTSEEDTLLVLKSKLNQAPQTLSVDNGNHSYGSDSDDNDGGSEILDSSNGSKTYSDRESADELADSFGSLNIKRDNTQLNAQLYVRLNTARDLPVTKDCAVYCLLSLGRQQVRTITCRDVNGIARVAKWSNEGFFFDVTHSDCNFTVSMWAEYFSSELNTQFLGELSVPISQLMNLTGPNEKEFKLKNKSGGGSASVSCTITYTTSKKKLVPDDFHYLTVLGRGNFGKVMQVRKKDTGRVYAMKILNKGTVIKHEAVQHTISEKNVLRRVHHPFIVSLKFSFQTEDKLYLVLDYLCGGELFTHLSNVDHFSEWRTKFYAAQIVLALGHLHELEVIYRDLKPENLMLDMDGYVCLTDFGLVKEGVAWDEKTNTYCGSPEYLAPEIILGKPYGKEVDWWALGTFVYEMLSGWPPFFDENHKVMNKRILYEPLTFDPKLFSKEAVSLLKGMLERNPERRLGSGPTGTQDIKSHPFFADIDWDKLLHRQIEPPFKPHLRNILDTKFFSPEFTGEAIQESFVESHLSQTYQDQFRGFSWVAPNELEKYPTKRRGRKTPMGSGNDLPSPKSPFDDSRDSDDILDGWSPLNSSPGTPINQSPVADRAKEKEGPGPSLLAQTLTSNQL